MFDKGTTLTQYEQDYILLEYPKVGVSARKLSELLGVNTYQIKKFLISQNISIKTISQAKTIYEVDHNYFDEMDSEEKAYFYGWLCADGCNSSDTKGVVIKIQEGDRNLLQKLNDLIQPTRPILFYPRRKPSEKNQVTMIIWSQRITNRLTELGCGPRKTFTLEWPEWMPENLWPAFLRGLNDGDGCISERGSVLITGSTILLKRVFKSIAVDSIGCFAKEIMIC